MMKFHRSLLLLAAFCPLVIGGCRNPAPGYVPAPTTVVEPTSPKVKQSNLLMPLQMKNQWTYIMKTQVFDGTKLIGSDEQQVVYRVAKQTGSDTVMLELMQDDKVVDRQEWMQNERGLYQTSAGTNLVPFSVPQPLALVPMDEGKTFTWVGRGLMPDGKMGEGRAFSRVEGSQNVDTSMGTLSAIPITTDLQYGRGTTQSVSWFRPKVGLIRFRQETGNPKGRHIVLLLTLTNYALVQ